MIEWAQEHWASIGLVVIFAAFLAGRVSMHWTITSGRYHRRFAGRCWTMGVYFRPRDGATPTAKIARTEDGTWVYLAEGRWDGKRHGPWCKCPPLPGWATKTVVRRPWSHPNPYGGTDGQV